MLSPSCFPFARPVAEIAELKTDFAGLTLHNWIGAPRGTGCLYVRQIVLKDIAPHFENRDWPHAKIRSRVLVESSNFAGFLTVLDAMAFHATFSGASLVAMTSTDSALSVGQVWCSAHISRGSN